MSNSKTAKYQFPNRVIDEKVMKWTGQLCDGNAVVRIVNGVAEIALDDAAARELAEKYGGEVVILKKAPEEKKGGKD